MTLLGQMHSWIRRFLLTCSILGTCWVGSGVRLAAQTEEASHLDFFERRVRPLLSKHCFACHGAAIENPQGNLRLDQRAGLLEGGNRGPAIVPHRPDESLLIRAVRGDPIQMPPGGKLKEREVADLVEWIRLGAPWPEKQQAVSPPAPEGEPDWAKIRADHWAWEPVRKPVPPKVSDESWVRNPIDLFVLAKLESAGLEPAPGADPATLVRRMHLDLTGLPPTPDAVAEFVEAARRDPQGAVEQKTTELLGSVRYGERWARHWLDVARYSDGFGGFLDRRNQELTQAWRYRDWVVSAFNDDLPYDRFIELQISGDLVGGIGDAVATGFFALGPYYSSDGGDPDSVAQARGETLDDRIDTLTRGFMAVTVSCARCHDHKFDPIPQQDYYSLAGIFDNTMSGELPLVPEGVVEAYDDYQEKIKAAQRREGGPPGSGPGGEAGAVGRRGETGQAVEGGGRKTQGRHASQIRFCPCSGGDREPGHACGHSRKPANTGGYGAAAIPEGPCRCGYAPVHPGKRAHRVGRGRGQFGQSTDGAGHGQSGLDASFRQGAGPVARQLRNAGSGTDP